MIKIVLSVFSLVGLLASLSNYQSPSFENYHASNCNSNFITIGEQIKEARIEKEMSIPALAQLSDLSVKQLSDVEAGKAEPVRDVTIRIEKILEASFIYGGYYIRP